MVLSRLTADADVDMARARIALSAPASVAV
jgi:hypothetical protein